MGPSCANNKVEADMLALLRPWRQPKTRQHRPPTVRLCVERLERRDCPSAPTLSFTVTQAGGHNVVLSGSVTDNNPSSVTVSFTGAVTATATANASGTFSITTTASALGTIAGQATDGAGLVSDAVQQTLTNTAPTIVNFQYVQEGGTTFTFTGT